MVTTNAACVVLVVMLSAFRLSWAARPGQHEITQDAQLGNQSRSRSLCDGAYTTPNYLARSGYMSSDAWMYGVPPGTKVIVKTVFSASLKFLEGKTGVVVTTDSFDGHGLVPIHLGSDEVCEFQGKIYFPDFPNGNLGQKNRNLGKHKGVEVFGMDMGGRVILKDATLPPSLLDEAVDESFKVTGPILDGTFKQMILEEVLEELPVEEINDIETITVSETSKPLLTIKPEVLLQAAELVPDSTVFK
eukprot:TRINITY_DN11127_c0_g2_i1.p1 TRINITY_DN11127_c0_g2~~TRINITY_DN11127_c0_g2_i1.p1  ORF type:complete len:246 (+),score=43.89 TRINITY_DN11127_c0_g2_i1:90-827(+)